MRYVTCDVFTTDPFTGNPLAVVLDADGLRGEQMQRIAAEFGYSETVFVGDPTEPGFDARLRIFTPRTELAFAGHPIVGTSLILAEGDRRLVFQVPVGPVVVEVRNSAARVAAPAAFEVLDSVDAAAVATAVGIDATAVLGQPVVASCGTPFLVAETTALDRARPGELDGVGATGLLLYARTEAALRARVFAPALGIPEDPATGSAALVLAGLLARESGPGSWLVQQGEHVSRPSQLHVGGDAAGATWVEGSAVVMMRGDLVALP